MTEARSDDRGEAARAGEREKDRERRGAKKIQLSEEDEKQLEEEEEEEEEQWKEEEARL